MLHHRHRSSGHYAFATNTYKVEDDAEFLKDSLLQHCYDLHDHVKRISPNFDNWFETSYHLPRIITELINSKACRSAIMFGDILTKDENARPSKQTQPVQASVSVCPRKAFYSSNSKHYVNIFNLSSFKLYHSLCSGFVYNSVSTLFASDGITLLNENDAAHCAQLYLTPSDLL